MDVVSKLVDVVDDPFAASGSALRTMTVLDAVNEELRIIVDRRLSELRDDLDAFAGLASVVRR